MQLRCAAVYKAFYSNCKEREWIRSVRGTEARNNTSTSSDALSCQGM